MRLSRNHILLVLLLSLPFVAWNCSSDNGVSSESVISDSDRMFTDETDSIGFIINDPPEPDPDSAAGPPDNGWPSWPDWPDYPDTLIDPTIIVDPEPGTPPVIIDTIPDV